MTGNAISDDAVLELFRTRAAVQLPTVDLFDAFAPHAHADVVRTLERLEHERRLLTRYANNGSDYP